MKEAIRGLNWRKLIMVSVLLGGIFSAFDITGSFTQTAFTDGYPGAGRCCKTSELTPGCQANGCTGSFFTKKCPTTPKPGSGAVCGDITCNTCF